MGSRERRILAENLRGLRGDHLLRKREREWRPDSDAARIEKTDTSVACSGCQSTDSSLASRLHDPDAVGSIGASDLVRGVEIAPQGPAKDVAMLLFSASRRSSDPRDARRGPGSRSFFDRRGWFRPVDLRSRRREMRQILEDVQMEQARRSLSLPLPLPPTSLPPSLPPVL